MIEATVLQPRKAAIVPFLAIIFPVLLLLAALGIFIAYAQLARTELRTATDFAARAGAKQLSLTQDANSAIQAAIDVAAENRVFGVPLQLEASDVVLGESRQNNGLESRFEFNPGGSQLNSVRVNSASLGNTALSGVITGLAGVSPNVTFESVATAANLDRDICVVVDRSGSMAELLTNPNPGSISFQCGPLAANTRFAALARAINVFIAELDQTPQQELISLASYSTPVNVPCRCCPRTEFDEETGETRVVDECPFARHEGCGGRIRNVIRFDRAQIHSNLSSDAGALRVPIQAMIDNGIGGGTAIGEGLRSGINAVLGPGARPFAFPTIILMTDGNHNDGINPEDVAPSAAENGIVIHTVTFSAGADQARMRLVAELTGGRHFHADTEAELGDAFREIARTLPVLLTQ